MRNKLVKYMGFTTSESNLQLPLESIVEGNQAGFLIIEHVSPQEVICGAYDKHMDMWVSVASQENQQFVLSTLVNLKTRRGHIYMALIKPFHKIIARYSIYSALKGDRLKHLLCQWVIYMAIVILSWTLAVANILFVTDRNLLQE